MINNPDYMQEQSFAPNPNQLQYNTANPNAMTNINALQALNPMATGINGVSAQNVQAQMQPALGSTSVYPAAGVATNIIPNNNLQTY